VGLSLIALFVAVIAGLPSRAMAVRLISNGYPVWGVKLILAASTVGGLLPVGLARLLDPRLFLSLNAPLLSLIVSLLMFGTYLLALVVARQLPPRRSVSVPGLRPRRYNYRRWIPVVAVLLACEAAGAWMAGATELAALAAVADVAAVVVLAIHERNYRNQEDAASALRRHGAILFLRTFTRDLFGQEEARLARQVRRQLGVFIALGNPREAIPPGGARRVYLADGAWRAQLAEMADRSQAILMWPDASPAVTWELGMIRDRGLQRKLFIVMPPPPPRRTWLYPRQELLRFLTGLTTSDWSDFARALQGSGFCPPEHDPGPGTVLAFEPDGRCVILTRELTSARDVVAQIAGRLAIAARAMPGPQRQAVPDGAGQACGEAS
jgi:hypothetical protein